MKAKPTQNYINCVFSNIADNYDFMNTVISMGMHKYYKRKLVKSLNIADKEITLDLAAGTGDIGKEILNQNNMAAVLFMDLNIEMLSQIEPVNNCFIINGDAEKLPVKSNTIDKVSIGFGIRNFQNLNKVFREIYRVLKPSGKIAILEFSQPPIGLIRTMRNFYFKSIVTKIARHLIHKNHEYNYLARSVINFYNQEKIISFLEQAGFTHCLYKNYLFGTIAIHSAEKMKIV